MALFPKIQSHHILAAAIAAAFAAPLPAAAQTRLVEPEIIVIGAIKDPADAAPVDDARDADIPELPVIEDDQQAPQAGAESAATATDGSTSRPNLGQPVEAE